MMSLMRLLCRLSLLSRPKGIMEPAVLNSSQTITSSVKGSRGSSKRTYLLKDSRKKTFWSYLLKKKVCIECLLISYLGLGPNIDFFTPKELDALSKKFKESFGSEDNNFGEEEEIKRDSSMAGFFDKNLNNLESGSMAKKMSIRRPTKKIEGTQLSRTKNVSCVIQK